MIHCIYIADGHCNFSCIDPENKPEWIYLMSDQGLNLIPEKLHLKELGFHWGECCCLSHGELYSTGANILSRAFVVTLLTNVLPLSYSHEQWDMPHVLEPRMLTIPRWITPSIPHTTDRALHDIMFHASLPVVVNLRHAHRKEENMPIRTRCCPFQNFLKKRLSSLRSRWHSVTENMPRISRVILASWELCMTLLSCS